MQGKIVSIVERYGFIKDGADSYYFNPRSMGEGQNYTDLSVGDFVEFDTTATPRGMAAKNVVKRVMLLCEVPATRFIITSKDSSEVVGNKTYNLRTITGEWEKSPSEAKNKLIESLKNLGVNCITNLQMNEMQMQKGNYYYKVRCWSCLAGIYLDTVPVNEGFDFEAQNASNELLLANTAKAVDDLEARHAANRKTTESNVLYWIFFIFVSIPLALLSIFAVGSRRR